MIETISINKGFGVALRLLNCPNDQIDSMCCRKFFARRACRYDVRSIVCIQALCGKDRLHSPDIRANKAPMLSVRNCLPSIIFLQDEASTGYWG